MSYSRCTAALFLDVGGPRLLSSVACMSIQAARDVGSGPVHHGMSHGWMQHGGVQRGSTARYGSVRAQAFGVPRRCCRWCTVYHAVGGMSVLSPVVYVCTPAPGLVYGRFSQKSLIVRRCTAGVRQG